MIPHCAALIDLKPFTELVARSNFVAHLNGRLRRPLR